MPILTIISDKTSIKIYIAKRFKIKEISVKIVL